MTPKMLKSGAGGDKVEIYHGSRHKPIAKQLFDIERTYQLRRRIFLAGHVKRQPRWHLKGISFTANPIKGKIAPPSWIHLIPQEPGCLEAFTTT